MKSFMEGQYLTLLAELVGGAVMEDNAMERSDRTGVGTFGVFGRQIRCNLEQEFPLLTTKKVHFKSIATELRWFLNGRTDVQFLQEKGCTIWDEWATAEKCAKFGRKEGDLGPVYGKQWRRFGGDKPSDPHGFDQLFWLVDEIKKNPNSRRLIVTGWDPHDAQRVALPPCHCLFQVQVQKGRLSLHNYMRSCDIFLGLPFNIASYALLTNLLAIATGNQAGDLVMSFGDLHLYKNHINQAKEQLRRDPYPAPRLVVHTSIEETYRHNINPSDPITFLENGWSASVADYQHHPAIKAEVAV